MRKRILIPVIILAITGMACRISFGKNPPVNQQPVIKITETISSTPQPIPTLITVPPDSKEGGQSEPVNLSSLSYRDAMHAWGVASFDSGDVFVQSADGGKTWEKVVYPIIDSSSTGKRISAAYLGNQYAWLVSYDITGMMLPEYRVIFTSDGGKSWQESDLLTTEGLEETFMVSHLTFVNESTGWLLAHVGAGMNHDYIVIYQTRDGGKTWQRLLDPFNDSSGAQSCTKSGIWFTDPLHGWLTGSCNGVAPGVFLFKTSDGGSTWNKVDLPVPAGLERLFGLETGYCGSVSSTSPEANVIKIGVLCQQFEPNPVSLYFESLSADNGITWEGTNQLPQEQMYAFHVEDEIDLTLAEVWMRSVGGGEPEPVGVSPAWPGFGMKVFTPDPVHWYAHVFRAGAFGIAFSNDLGENWEVIKPEINDYF